MKLGFLFSLLMLAGATFLACAIFSGMATLHTMAAEAEAVIGEDAVFIRDLTHLRSQVSDATRLARLAAEVGLEKEASQRARNKTAETLYDISFYVMAGEEDTFRRLLAAWDGTVDTLKALEENQVNASLFFTETVLPQISSVGAGIQDLEQHRQSFSLGRIEHINAAIETAQESLRVYALLLAATMLILFYEIRFRLIAPIRNLERATEVIASGELTHRITGLYPDELGQLGSRFNAMTEKLESAEKMKREFLAMVSHEMRTPLTSIGGFLAILLSGRRGQLAPRQKEALDIVQQETQRLGNLLEDLLDVARAEAGAFRITPAPTECADFFTALMQPYVRQAEELKIDFHYLFADLPDAVIDSRRMGQAIRNLLTNAFKFTPGGGKIRATGRQENGELVFEVEDTGPGMANDKLPRLFERFYQVNPDERCEGGMGLGLAIVREIAQAHGGTVIVESELGKGTRFRIGIPFRKESDLETRGSE
ncbi:MAG: ATP-binding protein [Candidatus Hydrogenedentota bacterium]